MLLEGALRRLPDGRFDILVREGCSTTRQRFSIAHELGHIIFHRHAPRAKAAQSQQDRNASPEEERLCNVAAEEFLMPATFLDALVEDRSRTPAAHVFELASRCEVSLEAAAYRLASRWKGRGEIQVWELRDGSWGQTLRRRLGHTRGSLAGFEVEEWKGAPIPALGKLPWTGATWLFCARRRERASARTSAILVPRRLPTVLVSHEFVPTRTRLTEVERSGRERVRRACAARPVPTCTNCGGTGWSIPGCADYDPSKRRQPVSICSCRYDQSACLALAGE
jgi:hypothetical protein